MCQFQTVQRNYLLFTIDINSKMLDGTADYAVWAFCMVVVGIASVLMNTN